MLGRMYADGRILHHIEGIGDQFRCPERRRRPIRSGHGVARGLRLYPLGPPAGHAGAGRRSRDRRGLGDRRDNRGVDETKHVDRRCRGVRGARRDPGRSGRAALPETRGAGGDLPLRRSADVDELTGLSSRSFFERAAGRRVEQARKNGTPLACILLDVDDFKAYNDSHGHGAGDEILRCLARVLRESARADDLVGRYGGEEFVLLVNGEVEVAREVAERIREAVQSACVPEPEKSPARPTTVSLGVVPLSEETRSLERLIAIADAEMYRSKKTGKNRVSVFANP